MEFERQVMDLISMMVGASLVAGSYGCGVAVEAKGLGAIFFGLAAMFVGAIQLI